MRNLARAGLVERRSLNPGPAEYLISWDTRLIARTLAVEAIMTRCFGFSIMPVSELTQRDERDRSKTDPVVAALPLQHKIALAHQHSSHYRPAFTNTREAFNVFVGGALKYANFNNDAPYVVWMPANVPGRCVFRKHCFPAVYFVCDVEDQIPEQPGPRIPAPYMNMLARQYSSAPNAELAERRDLYFSLAAADKEDEGTVERALEAHGRWYALAQNCDTETPWNMIEVAFVGRDDDLQSVRRLEVLTLFALESTGEFAQCLTTTAASRLLRFIVPRASNIAIDKFDAKLRKTREPINAKDKRVEVVYLDSLGYFKAK